MLVKRIVAAAVLAATLFSVGCCACHHGTATSGYCCPAPRTAGYVPAPVPVTAGYPNGCCR